MRTYAVILVGLLSLLLGSNVPAHAAGVTDIKQYHVGSPLLMSTASKCVRIMRRGNEETLINNCGSCQIVAVTRKRSGIAIPILRSFTIHDGIPYAMPFRGPGRSRITTIHSCQDEAADAQRSAGAQPASQCIKLAQSPTGRVVLNNSCGVCRAAAIQRLDRNGRVLNLQAYKLKARDTTPVAAKGAARVSLVADIDCPS